MFLMEDKARLDPGPLLSRVSWCQIFATNVFVARWLGPIVYVYELFAKER
ncbi:MAG: hypothetical protein RLN89_13805 [Parvibaculum sp.]